mgnify:CR=1 FL=1
MPPRPARVNTLPSRVVRDYGRNAPVNVNGDIRDEAANIVVRQYDNPDGTKRHIWFDGLGRKLTWHVCRDILRMCTHDNYLRRSSLLMRQPNPCDQERNPRRPRPRRLAQPAAPEAQPQEIAVGELVSVPVVRGVQAGE